MSAIHRVAKNTGVLFVSTIITFILGFLYMIYIARYLGPEVYGILSFAIAFTIIFGILADLGLSQLMVRELSRDKSLASKYLGNTIVMKIIASIITFLLIILIVNLIHETIINMVVIYLIALSVLINSFSQIFYSVFQSYEKMEFLGIGSVLSSILLFSFALLAMYYKFDVVFFAFIYLLVSIIILVFNMTICFWKFILPRKEIDLNFWKFVLLESIFFVLTGVFTQIYFNIDSVMLSLMISNEAVGFYTAAYKLIFILLSIPSVLIISLFPLMSKHFQSAQNILKLEYEKIFKFLFILALFLFLFGFIFADKIILIIYGSNYIPSIRALQILIFVLPIIFLTYLFGTLLGAINKQRFVAIVTGTSAVLNIILNILLIPKFSYFGASFATVITEIAVFILMFSYISKFFYKVSIIDNVLKPLIGALILAICIYLTISINWILAAILGSIIYIPILFLLNIIGKDDIALISELIKKRN
jgi:O-antigen/teichoic acid export membrane protein